MLLLLCCGWKIKLVTVTFRWVFIRTMVGGRLLAADDETTADSFIPTRRKEASNRKFGRKGGETEEASFFEGISNL